MRAEVRDTARRQIPWLAVGVLAFLVACLAYAWPKYSILHRWIDRPYLFVFPERLARSPQPMLCAQHPESQ